jgi:type IX secretion system PorP/SprF family membrane protein
MINFTKDMLFSKDKILIISLLLFSLALNAQYYPQYSQYMFNGLAINPAYAGEKDVLNLAVLYKNSQFGGGIEGAPVSQTLAADFPLPNLNVAVGVLVFNDLISQIRTSGAYFTYCYRLNFEQLGRLSFGIQAGFDLQREDLRKIVTLQPNDPHFTSKSYSTFMPNVGVGTYFQNKKFFIGASFPKLLKYYPQSAENYKEELTFSNFMLYGGKTFTTRKGLKIKPSTKMRLTQATKTGLSFDLNCNFVILNDLIELGASWRTVDTFVAMVGVKINSLYIGYAHDYAIKRVTPINSSHEIMLRYDFSRKVVAISPIFF